MSKRGSSFCPSFHRLFTRTVKRMEKEGLSQAEIIQALKRECPESSPSTFFRKVQHVKICESVGVGSECLTQTETRKYQSLPEREKKQVKKSFSKTVKAHSESEESLQPKQVRSLFRQSMVEVKPEIFTLKRRKVAPQSSERVSGHTQAPQLDLPSTSTTGEKSSLLQTHSKTRQGSKMAVAMDFSKSLPHEGCKCKGCEGAEYCDALADWRLKQRRLYQ